MSSWALRNNDFDIAFFINFDTLNNESINLKKNNQIYHLLKK